MFNKSSLFNRNDPIPRRDAVAAPATAPRPVGTASDNPAVRPAPLSKETATTAPVDSVKPSVDAAQEATAEVRRIETGAADTDSGMGARLIVGPEVKLKGAEILDCDTLVVEGRVEATMDSRVVRIAERGSFVGKVSIDIAEIHGSFEGELTARSQLIIHSTGRVKGTIRYGKLVADEGCELCGDVNVLSAGNSAKAKAVVEPVAVLNAAVG